MKSFQFRRVDTEEELHLLYEMVKELAETEGQTELFVATFDQYLQTFLGESPVAEGIVIYADREPIGFAVILRKFATYLGRETAYIEDLYLRTGLCHGESRLRVLSGLCEKFRSEGYVRVEMRVLKRFNLGEEVLQKAGFNPVDKWQVWRCPL
ncbi:hypothetical protein [Nitratifractor salsuginis]|uniref:GCN5-related N-acetyltransferase n=1 Tax=Nitratifractor salsuginis (strain DSM 16511 / JCM 12458 / E9I37-1) TaxID=749222 RepID=E6WYZ3_NITSE|nr:hypothetical protein [Nitratifractor salsuginis]ADV46579.1 GCN5-related N-acetyltransferase [Nitratifractor salsuginis DSM 16511]